MTRSFSALALCGGFLALVAPLQAQVLGEYTTSDGLVNQLTNVGEDPIAGTMTLELSVDSELSITIQVYGKRPTSGTPQQSYRVVVTPREGGPGLEIISSGQGEQFESLTMTYGGKSARYAESDPDEVKQEAKAALGGILSELQGSYLAERIARLRNVVDTLDPITEGILAPLHLLDGVIERYDPPDGAVGGRGGIDTYYECLRSGCRKTGGEWSYASGIRGGCHCNATTWGIRYCAAAATLYFMEAQWCWWSFLSPFK